MHPVIVAIRNWITRTKPPPKPPEPNWPRTFTDVFNEYLREMHVTDKKEDKK